VKAIVLRGDNARGEDNGARTFLRFAGATFETVATMEELSSAGEREKQGAPGLSLIT